MPTGPGGLDANGIWQYGEDDTEALASDLLNLGMGSVSTAVGGLGAPTILQVVSTTKTDTFSASIAAYAFTDITGLSASITPHSTSSKILVTVNHFGSVAIHDGKSSLGLTRGGTLVGIGDADGSRTRVNAEGGAYNNDPNDIAAVSFSYLDSPSTTASVDYQVQQRNYTTGTQTVYTNRSYTSPDAAASGVTASTITLMEVAG